VARISIATRALTPLAARNDVHACLRSWKRLCGSPATWSSRLYRRVRAGPSIGPPVRVVKTSPCSTTPVRRRGGAQVELCGAPGGP